MLKLNKKLGNDILDSILVIEDNKVINKILMDVIYPDEIQDFIKLHLHIDEELSHIIVYEWLYLNGMRGILKNWETPKSNDTTIEEVLSNVDYLTNISPSVNNNYNYVLT